MDHTLTLSEVQLDILNFAMSLVPVHGGDIMTRYLREEANTLNRMIGEKLGIPNRGNLFPLLPLE